MMQESEYSLHHKNPSLCNKEDSNGSRERILEVYWWWCKFTFDSWLTAAPLAGVTARAEQVGQKPLTPEQEGESWNSYNRTRPNPLLNKNKYEKTHWFNARK